MTAGFFGLAFLAALNPKLLAIDMLLIGNQRARAMFLWLLFGALVVAITAGMLDVLVFHLDKLSAQRTVSAGVDLSLGLLLLGAGSLIATGHLHRRRKEPVPAGGVPAHRAAPATAVPPPQSTEPHKMDGWAQRVLTQPRFGLAVLIGAVVGIPGAEYLAALHILVAGKYPAAVEVIGVIVFALIEFVLILIPFALLQFRPDATGRQVKNAQHWLLGHTRQTLGAIALILGAYLTVRGLVRLA
jgi:hypothetical protein